MEDYVTMEDGTGLVHTAPAFGAEDMSSAEALAIARSATPETREQADPNDPQGLTPGQRVGVAPDADGGDPCVEGLVVSIGIDTISVARSAPEVGDVVVHFPRVGYRVTPLD